MSKLLKLLISGLILSANSAYADSTVITKNNQHNLSRQPYQQIIVKDESKTENFEGATLLEQDLAAAHAYKTLQLHRFDRRPYMGK